MKLTDKYLCTSVLCIVFGLAISPGAMAGLIAVIGDVNAIGHDGNQDDIDSGFYDTILGSGTDVAFSRNNGYGLQVNISSYFNSQAGVSAVEEASVLTNAVLANYDMLVVTSFYDTAVDYSLSEISAISSWIMGGGSLLAIFEAPGQSQTLASYNAFLSGVGSSISFTGDRLTTIEADIPSLDPLSLGPLGVFDCNGCNILSGGSTVYSSQLGAFVAVENSASVPEPTALALLGVGLISLRLARGNRIKTKSELWVYSRVL